jgi:hypothetical protein
MFPKLKMKLKGLHFQDVAENQEAVTDALRKVQKEEFSAAFQKLYDCAKACICANGAYFEFNKKKKVCVFLVCLRFLKKISPRTFGPHCVLRRFIDTGCWRAAEEEQSGQESSSDWYVCLSVLSHAPPYGPMSGCSF